MTGEHGAARTAAGPQHAPEIFGASHPRLLRQHDTSCAARAALSSQRDLGGQPGQALSCSRPLRRRAASTARPARVRIRSRKP
jgi:hypothetical protein